MPPGAERCPEVPRSRGVTLRSETCLYAVSAGRQATQYARRRYRVRFYEAPNTIGAQYVRVCAAFSMKSAGFDRRGYGKPMSHILIHASRISSVFAKSVIKANISAFYFFMARGVCGVPAWGVVNGEQQSLHKQPYRHAQPRVRRPVTEV